MELFLDNVSILSRLDLLGSGFSLPSGGSRVSKVSISSAEVRFEDPISKSSSDKPVNSENQNVGPTRNGISWNPWEHLGNPGKPWEPLKTLTKVTGKSLSEALLFAEHGENMLCTKIVLNVRNNFCTQHVLSKFELGIFMY